MNKFPELALEYPHEEHLEIRFDFAGVRNGEYQIAVSTGPDEDHLVWAGDLSLTRTEWEIIATRLHLITADGTISTTANVRPL